LTLTKVIKTLPVFASPNSILIDDRKDNIDGWIENGGEGIVHTSAAETIKTLKEKYNLY